MPNIPLGVKRRVMEADQRIWRLESGLQKIIREAEGCGPECSADFLRLAIASVKDIARCHLAKQPLPQGEGE